MSTRGRVPGVVLLATVGSTDLQVVLETPGGRVRCSVGGDVRDFHEWLLAREDETPAGIVVDEGSAELPEGKDRFRWHEKEGESGLDDGLVLDARGCLVLVPAKLAEVVQGLDERGWPLAAAVLFGTRRDPSPEAHVRSEPVAAAPLLARWLASRSGLRAGSEEGDVGPGVSGWVDVLVEDWKSPGVGRDAPVHRGGARRIDRAVRAVAGTFERRSVKACVSTGGGLPEMKDVVRAAARYRFGDSRTLLWVNPRYRGPEDERDGWRDRVIPTPSDSLRGRQMASRLLLNGNLSGAIAAVAWMEQDPGEKAWVGALREAEQYLGGLLRSDTGKSHVKALLSTQAHRTLLVGCRVEAALRSGRLSEAILWTNTLFDTALLDHMAGLPGARLDDVDSQLGFARGSSPDGRLLEPVEGTRDLACLRRSGMDERRTWYAYRTYGPLRRRWLQVLRARALSEYLQALGVEGPRDGGLTPYGLRNLAVHSVIRASQASRARTVFQEAGLWQRGAVARGKGPGAMFLGMPKVAGVFEELGVPDAAARYAGLIEGLLDVMARHEIQ